MFSSYLFSFLVIVPVLLAEPLPEEYAAMRLGFVDFPVSSTDPDALAWFNYGLKHLLTFNYEFAEPAFKSATEADPNFALAYSLQAFNHYNPLWAKDDLEGANAILDAVPSTATADAREQLYIDAVKAHFNPDKADDKNARFMDHTAAFERITEAYPEDATAWSYVGLLRLELAGLMDQEANRAASLAALERSISLAPKHPGTNHFFLHFYDDIDPEVAVKAFDIAREFPLIAPDASHAQHMPVHIFIKLGMYNQSYASDVTALSAADKTCALYGRADDPTCDPIKIGHSVEQLQFFAFQLGKLKEAGEFTERMQATVDSAGEQVPWFYRMALERMKARDMLEKIFTSNTPDTTGESCPAPPLNDDNGLWQSFTDGGALMTQGLCLAFGGGDRATRDAELQQVKTELEAEIAAYGLDPDSGFQARFFHHMNIVQLKMVEAAELHAAGGDWRAKIDEAIAIEDSDSMDQNGSIPPVVFQSAHHLKGLLLLQGEPSKEDAIEAIESFESSGGNKGHSLHSTLGHVRALVHLECALEAQQGYASLLKRVNTVGNGADAVPYGDELVEGARPTNAGKGGPHCVDALVCRSRTTSLECDSTTAQRRKLLFGVHVESETNKAELYSLDPDCDCDFI